jgi:hypothetical protein
MGEVSFGKLEPQERSGRNLFEGYDMSLEIADEI